MSEKNGTPAVKPSVAELRAEIKQTRAEWGETVQALAAAAATEKVRAVAGQAAEKVKENAPLDRDGAHRPLPGGAGAVRSGPLPAVLRFAGVVAIVGVVLIVRGRRR